MANFRYRAYSAQGELAEGELEARTAAEAEAGLWARGLVAFETRKLERAGEGDWCAGRFSPLAD